jgi:uncharacterized protein (DUF4415 family)
VKSINQAEKAIRKFSLPLTDPDVIARLKVTGKGWQSRMNEILKRAKV